MNEQMIDHPEVPELAAPELAELVLRGRAGEELGVAVGVPAVRVVGEVERDVADALAPRLASLPCVVLADESVAARAAAHAIVDAFVPDGWWDAVLGHVASTPIAAASLVMLLRGGEARSIDAGLVAESATYSTLQSGPEFAAWHARRAERARPARPTAASSRPAPDAASSPTPDAASGPLLVERHGDILRLTLNRAATHNAWSAALRDAVSEALQIALCDDSVAHVELHGAGPSFCSGGDLTEFGSLPNPATAHAVRLARSPARLLSLLGDRVVSYLHGACIGAGIEMPSFGGRVIAHPDTYISLPELALGLIPGAGGTVSIPRRIGRHRTALLALSAMRVDVATAAAWGLVDEISEAAAG